MTCSEIVANLFLWVWCFFYMNVSVHGWTSEEVGHASSKITCSHLKWNLLEPAESPLILVPWRFSRLIIPYFYTTQNRSWASFVTTVFKESSQ